jgi:hypothetical protein
MRKVIVYLNDDFTQTDIMFVDEMISKEELILKLDKNYKKWFTYDII